MSVTVLEALKALKAMAEGPDKVTLAQLIVERHVAEAPKENTGLPCRLCGQNQARIDLSREEEKTSVRVAGDGSSDRSA